MTRMSPRDAARNGDLKLAVDKFSDTLVATAREIKDLHRDSGQRIVLIMPSLVLVASSFA
jgi:hypothetical protein